MKFDIEEYIESNLSKSRPVNSKNGFEYTAVCPSCNKYGGFYINIDSGAYLCNKCEFRSNSVIGLVAHVEGISWSEARSFIFSKTIKLRRKSDVFSLSDRIRGIRETDRNVDETFFNVDLPDRYIPVFDEKRQQQWKIPTYLKKRKIKSITVKKWGLGYCDGGKYENRLIIPIDCPNGVSWTGRSMGDQKPKYLNPPSANHSSLLIGWNVSMITGDIVLCEGPIDAISLWQMGVSVLGLGGKELHDGQLSLLMTLSKNSAITIMLDPEETVAPYKIAERLSVHFDYIFIARLPLMQIKGEPLDPGNAPKNIVYDALNKAERWNGSRLMKIRSFVRKGIDL